MNSATLLQLYQDHQGKVSDKWLSYLTEYERVLSPHKADPVHLLEIGIQNGGSLEIWARYFNNAKIILGCDIDQACSRLRFDDERIRVLVGNANSGNCFSLVQELTPSLDIVIDDGSHTSGDIIQSFARYYPLVSPNGLYIIEDLHCSYWETYEGGLFYPMSSMAFFKNLADIINFDHWGLNQGRSSPIKGILENHQATLDDSELATIHSIEFVNSMCIVRKARHRDNGLGIRVVAGTSAGVDLSPLECPPNFSMTPESQDENAWSNLTTSPAEELNKKLRELSTREEEIKSLSSQVSEYEAAVNRISNSYSWRLTYPLRAVYDLLHSAGRITDTVKSVIRAEGGVPRTFSSLFSVLKSKGIRETYSRVRGVLTGSDHIDYAGWIQAYDTLDDAKRKLIRERIRGFRNKPQVSILMPTYNTPLAWLKEAIESVKGQLYENWELCIADDASTSTELREFLKRSADGDPRIKVIFRDHNGHISKASNSALELCSGEWTALFDHDDLLPEHALYHVVKAINENPDVQLIFSDEDKVDEKGKRTDPYFKCNWNRDLFYSQNLISHLGVYKTAILNDIGGFRQGFEGSQDHDLALRYIEQLEPEQIFHIPHVLYHWRVHRESASHSSRAKPYAASAGVKALQSHFDRIGISALVDWTGVGYRVKYNIEEPYPLVSILVRSCSSKETLNRLLDSLNDHTHYQNFEVLLLSNDPDDLDTLDDARGLNRQYRYRIIREPWSAEKVQLFNSSIQQARGSVICLLSDQAELTDGQWLTELVSNALQPGVAAVGPKLLDSDGIVQYCGLVLGGDDVAEPAFSGLPANHAGYFGRAELVSSFSAINSDCLVIKKTLFEKVNGYCDEFTTPMFADIDLCLRLHEAGFRNVVTPFAKLLLHGTTQHTDSESEVISESPSQEYQALRERWEELIEDDPCFSPNLELGRPGFNFAYPPRAKVL